MRGAHAAVEHLDGVSERESAFQVVDHGGCFVAEQRLATQVGKNV
jgi:hypothetical protein